VNASQSKPPQSPPPTNVRWIVFALASVTSWLLYVHRYSWGVIKPDIKAEFQLDDVQLGWLDSAFSLAYACGQIPGGWAGDVWGPSLVLSLMIFAWSVAVGCTVFGRDVATFSAIRIFFGASQAGAYPNVSKVTKSWFPYSIRTTAQGIIASASGRVGGACAPLVIGTVLMGWMGLGWRASLLLLAMLGIVFAVVFRLLFRNTPAEHPWSNEAEQQLIAADEPPVSPRAKVVFSRRPMVLVTFGFLLLHIFTSAFADMLYVYWIPYFLLDAKGLSREAMGFFASLPLFGGALGGMCGGILNDVLIRYMGRRWARSVVGVSGKLVAAALVGAALMVEDGRWMMLILAVAKFFTDWSQPTLWGAVTDIAGPAAGRVFGTVNTAGSIGGMVANPILGYIKSLHGWNAVFWLIAAAYVASGLCWLAIDTTKPLVIEEPKGDHQG
jgi:ACS family glucarate transporter-like MFS transporter